MSRGCSCGAQPEAATAFACGLFKPEQRMLSTPKTGSSGDLDANFPAERRCGSARIKLAGRLSWSSNGWCGRQKLRMRPKLSIFLELLRSKLRKPGRPWSAIGTMLTRATGYGPSKLTTELWWQLRCAPLDSKFPVAFQFTRRRSISSKRP